MLKNCQVSLFITAAAEAFGLPSLLFRIKLVHTGCLTLKCAIVNGSEG